MLPVQAKLCWSLFIICSPQSLLLSYDTNAPNVANAVTESSLSFSPIDSFCYFRKADPVMQQKIFSFGILPEASTFGLPDSPALLPSPVSGAKATHDRTRAPPLGRQRHRISSSSGHLMYPTASLLQFCPNTGITGRSNKRSNVMLGCTPCDEEDSAEVDTCTHRYQETSQSSIWSLRNGWAT